MNHPGLIELLSKGSDSFRKANAGIFGIKSDQSLPELSKAPNSQGMAEKKATKSKRVARSRNGGEWTNARYWQTVRSALRRTFRFWKPALAALHAARVPCRGPHGQKWAYICAGCQKIFPRKQVQIDHKEAVGALTCLEHLPEFLARLTPEDPTAFQVLCKERCHRKKTLEDQAK